LLGDTRGSAGRYIRRFPSYAIEKRVREGGVEELKERSAYLGRVTEKGENLGNVKGEG